MSVRRRSPDIWSRHGGTREPFAAEGMIWPCANILPFSQQSKHGSDGKLVTFGSQIAPVNLGEILSTILPIGGDGGGGSDESPCVEKRSEAVKSTCLI